MLFREQYSGTFPDTVEKDLFIGDLFADQELINRPLFVFDLHD